MNTVNNTLETTLVVRKTYPASPDVLFQAWTQPEHMQHWFSPKEEVKNTLIEVDLKVGGKYRIGFKEPDKNEVFVSGEYTEIIPGKKLVFTWMWDHLEFEDTLVTIDFFARGSETEVVLTHECFPEKQMRDHHNEGWTGCFNRLAIFISKQ